MCMSAVGGHGERGISEERVCAAEGWDMIGIWAGVLGVFFYMGGGLGNRPGQDYVI